MSARVAKLFCLSWLVFAGSHAVAQEFLRVAVSAAWTLPIGHVERERLTAGVMEELYRELGGILGMSVHTLVFPRKRLDGAALAGDYDLRCYLNPKWTDTPDQYTWSKSLFEVTNVVIGSAKTGDPKSIDGLAQGSAISTVLGYSYPALDALISSGTLRREDTVDEEKVLLKLTAGRTPYGVATTSAVNWYRRTTPAHRLSEWSLAIARTDVYCAVPKASAAPAARILDAVEQLIKAGRVQAILKNYQ